MPQNYRERNLSVHLPHSSTASINSEILARIPKAQTHFLSRKISVLVPQHLNYNHNPKTHNLFNRNTIKQLTCGLFPFYSSTYSNSDLASLERDKIKKML
jgi:hypothetical protein